MLNSLTFSAPYLAIQFYFTGKVATLQNYSCSGTSNDEIKESEIEDQLKSQIEEKEIANAKTVSLQQIVNQLRSEMQQSQERFERLIMERDNTINVQSAKITSLEKMVRRQSKEKDREMSSLMQQVSEMQEDEKQREEEVQQLKEEVKRLKLRCVDETQYEQWSHEEIAAWILNLDKGRLKQYEPVLRERLKEEEVDGQLLHTIDGSDVKRWGIIKMRDFKYLQTEIQRLVTKKSEQGIARIDINALANEGANAAPTAFV